MKCWGRNWPGGWACRLPKPDALTSPLIWWNVAPLSLLNPEAARFPVPPGCSSVPVILERPERPSSPTSCRTNTSVGFEIRKPFRAPSSLTNERAIVTDCRSFPTVPTGGTNSPTTRCWSTRDTASTVGSGIFPKARCEGYTRGGSFMRMCMGGIRSSRSCRRWKIWNLRTWNSVGLPFPTSGMRGTRRT